MSKPWRRPKIARVVLLNLLVAICFIPSTLHAAWEAPPSEPLHRMLTVPSTTALFSRSPPQESSRREWISGGARNAAAVAAALIGLAGPPASAATEATTVPPNPTVPPPLSKSAVADPVLSSKTTCDPSVSVWTKPSNGRKVYLLGTAHISSVSANLAEDIVRDVNPSGVFLELDASRCGGQGVIRSGQAIDTKVLVERDMNPPSANLDNGAAIAVAESSSSAPPSSSKVTAKKEGRNPFLTIATAIASRAIGKSIEGMYQKMGEAGFQPGEEFERAIITAQEIGSVIILGDQEADATLRRLTNAYAVTDWDKMKEAEAKLNERMKDMYPDPTTIYSPEDFENQMSTYLEAAKERTNVRMLMDNVKTNAPDIYRALVSERDLYMATGLDRLDTFPTIVAIMGVGHLDGIEGYLSSQGWKPAKLKCPKR